MQDIDFDALDQEVNKIMDQKKQAAEKKARIRQQQGCGRNMDIVNVAHPIRLSAVSQARVATQNRPLSATRPSSRMQDIRPSVAKNTTANRVTNARSVSTPVQSSSGTAGHKPMVATQSVVKSVAKPLNDHLAQARGANLLRQRRRLNQAGQLSAIHNSANSITPSSVMSAMDFGARTGESVIKGRHQSETLSTKQSDGSETIYQYDSVDYVAKISPNQQKVDTMLSSEALDDKSVVDLDAKATAEAFSQPKVAARASVEPSYKEYSQSPFLETAKVDKRPLGVPYDQAKTTSDYQATLQIENQSDDEEVALYRGDLRTDEKSSKLNSVIWIILTIIAIIGAAVGIYLMTVYNK